MFNTVLIANRGEIASRVIRTLRAMSITSVAVYSDADADAPFVREADIAVRIGPASAAESYLRIDRIIEAALQTGAQALHPGYGFLAENVDLAEACAAAGITFIGPPVGAMLAMADKIRAKVSAVEANVPVVPGRHDAQMSDEQVAAAVKEIGLPALLKPSAGGGGKGMQIITDFAQVDGAIASARREARASFGDDTLLVERYVNTPRHIEVQIIADAHGNVLHLGERECSLQRRHQKVIEEAPSPLLDAHTRALICDSAVRLAKAVGYVGAGTVEYVVPSDAPQDFAFLEMNTRLQVEHPVTELVTGVDLVECQIRVAAGEPLSFTQADVTTTGHAVEARVYAEDADRGFLPTGGEILTWAPPTGTRVDSGIVSGSVVGSMYDPMLAKVISWAPDRVAAIESLGDALSRTVCLGITTNISFLRRVLALESVRTGVIDTGLLGRLDAPAPAVPYEVFAAAALIRLAAVRDSGPWDGAWRVGGYPVLHVDVQALHEEPVSVQVTGTVAHAHVRIGELEFETRASIADDLLTLTANGVTSQVRFAQGDALWLHNIRFGIWGVKTSLLRDRALRSGGGSGHGVGPWIARSPMPGAVANVPVAVGQEVAAGEAVVAVEAMKMEHTLRSPGRGIVTEIRVAVGQQVKLDEDLVIVDLIKEEG